MTAPTRPMFRRAAPPRPAWWRRALTSTRRGLAGGGRAVGRWLARLGRTIATYWLVVSGLACITTGIAVVSSWGGFIAAGICLLLLEWRAQPEDEGPGDPTRRRT